MLTKVISGGQLGADMAGLDAAMDSGILTGGTAAYGYLQSINRGVSINNFDLRTKYGLREGAARVRAGRTDPYSLRTVANVMESDATMWFGRADSPGGSLTINTAIRCGKPYLANPVLCSEIARFLQDNSVKILNVAGNREWTYLGIYAATKRLLLEAFLLL